MSSPAPLANQRGVALLRGPDGRDLCDRCGFESGQIDCLDCLVQFCAECSRDVHTNKGKWAKHQLLVVDLTDEKQAVPIGRRLSMQVASKGGLDSDSVSTSAISPASVVSSLGSDAAVVAGGAIPVVPDASSNAPPASVHVPPLVSPSASVSASDSALVDGFAALNSEGYFSSIDATQATLAAAPPAPNGNLPPAFMRAQVLNEIMTTESEYVRDLDIFARVYVAPILAGKFSTLVSVKKADRTFDIRVVFSTMELIRQHNLELLRELTEAGMDNVGSTFARKLDNFTLYSVYCNNQGEVIARIEKAARADPNFAKFLADCKQNPDTRMLSFEDFFIKPFQRILKYPLLLKELIKYTPEDYADYEHIAAAIDKIQDEVNSINKNKADQDNLKKCRDLSSRIENLGKIVLLDLTFLKQGTMTKISGDHVQEREFFLFSDRILYCKKSATNSAKWVLRGTIELEHLIVEDLEDTDKLKNGIQLTRANENLTYIVLPASAKEKYSWLRELERAREQAVTGNTRLHGVRPIWRPDSAVTHCSGCGGKFTFRNRRHHCRHCGHIFCGLCCSNFVDFPEEFGFDGKRRACINCLKTLQPDPGSRVRISRMKIQTDLTKFTAASLAYDRPEASRKEGYLVKKGHKRRNWNRRYFVLHEGILHYFSDAHKYEREKAKLVQYGSDLNPDKVRSKGYFRLREYSLHTDLSDKYRRCLYLQGEDAPKNYVIRSDTDKELADWVSVLRILCQQGVPIRRGRGGSVFSDAEGEDGPIRESLQPVAIVRSRSPSRMASIPSEIVDFTNNADDSSRAVIALSESRDAPSGKSNSSLP